MRLKLQQQSHILQHNNVVAALYKNTYRKPSYRNLKRISFRFSCFKK